MKTLQAFVLFIQFLPHLIIGQNLIVNPDFRKTSDEIFDLIDNLDGLKGFGTVDFYHSSNEKFFPWNVPPYNWLGFAHPLCGEGYGGFILYNYRGPIGNIRASFEHIQFFFKEPLIKDSTYQICFYIKLANRQYFSKKLGIFFSADSNFVTCSNARMGRHIDYINCFDSSKKAHIEINDILLLSDTSWTKISANYTALGGEKYMTIGVFWQENRKISKAYFKCKKRTSNYLINTYRQNRLAKIFKQELLDKNPYIMPPTTQWGLDNKEKGAYYFIDCVSVELNKKN